MNAKTNKFTKIFKCYYAKFFTQCTPVPFSSKSKVELETFRDVHNEILQLARFQLIEFFAKLFCYDRRACICYYHSAVYSEMF